MTTRVNKFKPGEPVPVRPRIVIEFTPTGQSILKTYGGISYPLIIDTLMAQMLSIWQKWMKESTMKVMGPDGLPLMDPNAANAKPPDGEPEREYKKCETDGCEHYIPKESLAAYCPDCLTSIATSEKERGITQ